MEGRSYRYQWKVVPTAILAVTYAVLLEIEVSRFSDAMALVCIAMAPW